MSASQWAHSCLSKQVVLRFEILLVMYGSVLCLSSREDADRADHEAARSRACGLNTIAVVHAAWLADGA